MSSKNVFNKIDMNNNFGNIISPALDVLFQKCEMNELNRDRPCNMLSIIAYICQDHIADIHGTLLYIFFTGAAQVIL